MTDLIIAFILLVFIIVGLSRPNVAIMGYIWIDLIKPQSIAYGFISGQPLSKVIAIICILSILFNIKKLNKLKDIKITLLLLLFAIWVTITTSFSLFPDVAWLKWNWAFKTIIAAVVIPFTIKDKKSLEALIWVFLASVSFYTISAGAKTMFGGGGYGARLISGGSNFGLAESSTLALAALICLPLLIHLLNNTLLMNKTTYYKIFIFALLLTSILTVIGSYARTGLIGLFIFGCFMFVKSNQKFKVIIVLSFLSVLIYSLAPDTWFERMGTIGTASEDSSALGRIVVWKWTFDFAKDNFFGGGFHAYIANAGFLNAYHDNPHVIFDETPKAFHSVYFEVMGEHGFFGFALYLSIILGLFMQLRKVVKNSKDSWEVELSKSLSQSLYIFCACAAFVGVAFQPIFYILAIFVISLSNLRPASDKY